MLALAIAQALAQEPQPDQLPTFSGEIIEKILGYGLIGCMLVALLFNWKIQPTYVHERARAEWERERARLEAENADLKETIKESTAVYAKDVVPMMTLVAERMVVWIQTLEDLQKQAPRGRD